MQPEASARLMAPPLADMGKALIREAKICATPSARTPRPMELKSGWEKSASMKRWAVICTPIEVREREMPVRMAGISKSAEKLQPNCCSLGNWNRLASRKVAR